MTATQQEPTPHTDLSPHWVWAISNQIVLFSSERLTSHRGLTLMFMQWGQFIDHDLDFTPEPPARVAFTVGVDYASMVYGSEVSLALQLCNQTNHPGLLAISTCFSDNGWARLPFDNLCDDPYLLTNPSLCVPCSPADRHLLRLSAPGSGQGPGSPREKTLGLYRGSCSNVDRRAASVFTLAFRFGHTMLQPFMFRLDSQWHQPHHPRPHGHPCHAEPRFRVSGRAAGPALLSSEEDRAGPGGSRHATQPGPHRGLLGHNAQRRFCGLSQPRNLAQLSQVLQNPDLARKLLNLNGTPDNTDVWIGAIAEPLSPGAQVGPLLVSLFENQFTRALGQISWSGIVHDHTGIPTISRDIFRANAYPQGFVSCTASPGWICQPGKANEDSAGKGGALLQQPWVGPGFHILPWTRWLRPFRPLSRDNKTCH
ncbi:eosinophil peroxidase-like [Lynx pardinus]|uniref:Eosinophil peroxidase-like n=1 Tax=Lynx pardinus TaxID=191816 RepID=A0A485NYV3_LYNPA|nr:eosinophil peroxidase-like [Lynx pardinus]